MELSALVRHVRSLRREQGLDRRLQLLVALLADARAGRAHFKVYRQFKMYNDAKLNPARVAEAKQRG